MLLFILPEYYKICGVDDTVYEAIDKDPTHKFSGSGITGAYTKTNAGDYLSTESEYIYGSGLVYKFWYSNTKEDKGAVQKLFKEGHAHYSVKDCY